MKKLFVILFLSAASIAHAQTACTVDANCNDNVWCSGVESCVSGFCASGTPPCANQICREKTKTCATYPAVVTVDPSTQYQTITGWEATAEAGEFASPHFTEYAPQVFALAVNELGLTRLRIELPSGIEGTCEGTELSCYHPVNDDADPNTINWNGFDFVKFDQLITQVVLPMKALVEANGEHLFVNLNYVHFGQPPVADLHAQNPAEYAEFILAALMHLQTQFGLSVDAIEPLLEPENSGTQWSGSAIGNAIVATKQVLAVNGFTPAFIAPSTTAASHAVSYYDSMLAVGGLSVSEFSYHRYVDSTAAANTALPLILSRAQRDGGSTSMLEHIGSGVEDLISDLTIANVSAWQQFTIATAGHYNAQGVYVLNDGGGAYYLINDTQTPPVITVGSRTKLLRQYFRYLRPGATRIRAVSTVAGLVPIAASREGKATTIVKAANNTNFGVAGMPAGRYGVNFSWTNAYNKTIADYQTWGTQLVEINMPGPGVISIFGK